MSNDRTPFGAEDFRDVEERLRVALAQEARDVEPTDRLEDIRAEVDAGAGAGGRPRWLGPVGAAAAVAAIAVVAWLGLRPGSPPPVPVGSDTATASVSTSSPSQTSSVTTSPPSSSGTGTQTAPPATSGYAAPAYFVGPYQNGARWGLVREFLPAQLPAGADPPTRATAALNLALNAQRYTNTDGYLQPWPSGTAAKVELTAQEIQVELSGPGVTGLTPEQQRVSVQQIVWTVTAAVGQNLPVRVSVAGGGAIFEAMPANVYKRPAADTAYIDLAPIWIDSPSRDQVLSAGAPVTVTGQACTFEANVQWELRQGTKVVKTGHTTASSGCPVQGSYSIDLGKLAAGAYTIRAFELSAKDGSLNAQKVVSFTVA